MDDAHHHRPVPKRRIWRSVEYRRGGLIQHSCRGLIYSGGLASGARLRGKCGKIRGVQIRHLGTTWLVSCEVVTRQQNSLQRRMPGIHARVNVRDNPRSRHIERRLRGLHLHDPSRRLIGVTVPHICPAIGHRTSVRHECAGNWSGKEIQAAYQVQYLVHFGIHESRQARQETQKSLQWERCGHQENLAHSAVQRANHCARCGKETEHLEHWEPPGRPNDHPSVGLRRRSQQQSR